MNEQKQAFTLVELIVVITILAILGTIAFISLQGYSSNSRDSVRISDVGNMKTSLELFHLNAGKYPLADNGNEVSYSGELLWTQGKFGETVIKNVSRNLNKIPKDPLTDKEYIYSVSNTKNEYQILSLLENDDFALNKTSPQPSPLRGEGVSSIFPQTNAEGTLKVIAKLDGEYNGVFIKSPSHIVPTPSLINAEVKESDITLNSTNILSQVLNKGLNIPEYGNVISKTGALNMILSVYNGTITKDSTDTEKLNAIQTIKNAYSDSSLISDLKISSILNTTDTNELILLTNTLILKNKNISSNSLTGWMAVDKNCKIPDIKIYSGSTLIQTWAGCNSTIGNGFEFGQIDTDIGTNNYSGIVGSCFDYNGYDSVSGTGLLECTPGNITMSSTTKANTWFSGININGDREFDTIWGKYYTWQNALDTACSNGRHVPTDIEWEILETILNGGINCRNGTNGWLCDGLGWKFHSDISKNNFNNLSNVLKLPLSGYRTIDGFTFSLRGKHTYLWSRVINNNSLYSRKSLDSDFISVRSYLTSNLNGFSVRCIKNL